MMTPRGALWPWWRRCGVVLGKEVKDHLRDSRSLVLALLYPLLGPLALGLLLQVAADARHVDPGAPALTVAARGLDHAPELAAFLAGHNVTLNAMGEAAAGGGGGAEAGPVTLEIPAAAAAGAPFTVRLLFDANSTTETATARRLADLITGYSRQLGQRLLTARGLDPGLIQPVTVERIHTGRRLDMALLLYSLISPLLVFMIFLGAVPLVLDSTIGERERGTLEPLLTTPIRRWEVLLGKAGAAFLFTLVTVLLNLSAFRLVLSLLAAGAPGGQPPPDSAVFGLILVMALPVMALAVTLQLAIAALARTLKEAQIYLGLLPLVPALPGIASAMTPLVPQLWTSGVPVFGQMLVFNRLIAGAPVEPAQALLSAVTTLLTAVLIFWWATRLYEQDRTVVAGG